MNVIIVGGGMIGSTLALMISHLTKGQIQVHLIESVDPKTNKELSLDARAIALSQSTCQHLTRIGIWKSISDCATPIRIVHVSEQGHIGFTSFNAQDYHLDALGQVVELSEVKRRLFCLLKDSPGIDFQCPAQVVSISRNISTVSVTLNTGEILESPLLIAADGSNSLTARQFDIERKEKFYNQVAIISTVSTDISHGGCAWERFTKHGPLAMLPISHKRCSLVWCHSLDRKDEVLSWSKNRFCTELQKVFGWRLGHIKHVSNRTAYALTLTIATRFITHRGVLVGNASQSLHPIAGQGFNLGLRDVISLAEMIIQSWCKKRDYGEYSVLYRYQQQRQKDKLFTISATDDLITLFTNQWTPLIIGRNVGLIATELFIPIRNIIAQRALGWVGY